MPRIFALLTTVVLTLVTLSACGADETSRPPDAEGGTVSAGSSERGEKRQAARKETAGTGATTAAPTREYLNCSRDGGEEIRVGDFAAPEEAVPPYEIIENEPVEEGCVEAVRLLVDTQANTEADYALIARDIKAEYAELDAVTVEFTDTSGAFSYEGAALIFNTPPGAYFIGYAYGPPNNEGYYVTVAD